MIRAPQSSGVSTDRRKISKNVLDENNVKTILLLSERLLVRRQIQGKNAHLIKLTLGFTGPLFFGIRFKSAALFLRRLDFIVRDY